MKSKIPHKYFPKIVEMAYSTAVCVCVRARACAHVSLSPSSWHESSSEVLHPALGMQVDSSGRLSNMKELCDTFFD